MQPIALGSISNALKNRSTDCFHYRLIKPLFHILCDHAALGVRCANHPLAYLVGMFWRLLLAFHRLRYFLPMLRTVRVTKAMLFAFMGLRQLRFGFVRVLAGKERRP